MDNVPAVKVEELKTDLHEQELELDTDEEAAKLDLDEQELALQLRVLQHKRKRLENMAKQRKRSAQTSRLSTARASSHTPDIQRESTTAFRVPPCAVVVEVLSDSEEPQVKLETEQNSSTGIRASLESIPPAGQDTVMTGVTGVLTPEREQDHYPMAEQATAEYKRTMAAQITYKTSAGGAKHKTPLTPATTPKKHIPKKGRKELGMKTPASASKLGQKERYSPSQTGVTKPPITPKKKRLTIKEQLTQELEDLQESSPLPDICDRGRRARPLAGTYRIQLGLTQQDIQPLLAHFCMRTLDHVCSRLSDNGRAAFDRVVAIFERPRQRLAAAEYPSMEEFVNDIRSIMEAQVCRDCDRQYVSRYLDSQQSNWEECKEECESKSNDEERSKIVDEWAVLAGKS